jgi:hypothetical protein
MIKQSEIQNFVTISDKWDTAKESFKLVKVQWEEYNTQLAKRYSEGEKVESGKYQLNLKTSSRTTTKYKEVMEGLVTAVKEGLNHKAAAVKEFAQNILNILGAMLSNPEIVKVNTEPIIEVLTEKKVTKLTKVA